MALIPLNQFKTKTQKLVPITSYVEKSTGNNTATVYTAPIGVTSIVLMAQVANLTTQTQLCSFVHHRQRPILSDAQGNGAQEPNVDSYLVKDFAIPAGDSASVLTGKLIIETLDSIRAYSHSDSTSTLQLVLSILESANT
jgi:hypothetical protein